MEEINERKFNMDISRKMILMRTSEWCDDSQEKVKRFHILCSFATL